MASKNQNSNARSAEDRALDLFADLMIEKIQNIQQDWKKPWFTPQSAQLPRNLSGRQYNGFNSIVLMMMQEKHGWQTSRYATFDRISAMNYQKDKEGGRVHAVDKDGEKLPLVSVNKGEKSNSMQITKSVNSETKERIKYDDYKLLSEDERAKYNVYPKLQVYNVFNLDQTNLKEARPEMYQKFLYVCPIKPTFGDDAYYSISKDEIVIPEKKQFTDGEAFYSNLLHEMSHASGSESRLNRLRPASFGSSEYSREELVAELTAALVSSQHGMTKGIKADSAAYLKSWLDQLHQEPDFIKTVLMDVKKSSSFINQRIDAVQMKLEKDGWEADFSEVREQNKTYMSSFSNDKGKTATATEQQTQSEEQSKPEVKEQAEEIAAKNVAQPRFHR